MRWFQRSAESPKQRVEPSRHQRKPVRITEGMVAQITSDQPTWGPPPVPNRAAIFTPPKPMPGVLPTGMAFDSTYPKAALAYASFGQYGEVIAFPGYSYLSELTQRAEYRRAYEIIAKEMTRKGFALKATGDDDKSDRIKELTELAQQKYHVTEVLRQAAEQDGAFGIGHVYIDTGDTERSDELKTGLWLDRAKIKRGSLRAFRPIEPIWTYPNNYNADNPLRPDFYLPQSWYVMGTEIHRSRLMQFVSREMPDLLKPAYMFGGMSLSQLGQPYVQNWLETRASVNRLIQSFATPVLATELDAMIQPGSLAALIQRLAMFNQTRSNRGVFAINKETEQFSNVTTPLATLDQLQAQAQEHMSSCWKIPLVVLLGITPSGLNATTDGEIRTFYDWIHASQCALFDDNLRRMLDIIQLSEFGEIDKEITHEWLPLWQLDEAGKAAVQKTKADTAAVLIEAGVIAAEEERNALAADPESQFHGLGGPPPELPEMEKDPDTNGGELTAETKSKERDGV